MATTNIAYSNIAVDAANKFFSINAEDHIVTKGAKATGRAVTQTFIALAALTETVFFAALTTVLSPLYFASYDRFTALKNHTKDAASATVNATKGIAGYSKKEEVAPAAPKSLKDKLIEFATSKYSKTAISTVLVTAFLFLAYTYGKDTLNYFSGFSAAAASGDNDSRLGIASKILAYLPEDVRKLPEDVRKDYLAGIICLPFEKPVA
ncbi:MAG: hypothetical protein K1000chlam3_00650 [Chlamydiae bacterium]|nr:hypothetical protein [Chlamydiota bacterium]